VAVFSVVFERQGEGSGEVNGLAHVSPRRLADNRDRVHATTWHRPSLNLGRTTHLIFGPWSIFFVAYSIILAQDLSTSLTARGVNMCDVDDLNVHCRAFCDAGTPRTRALVRSLKQRVGPPRQPTISVYLAYLCNI
jgi:hypothetical protein